MPYKDTQKRNEWEQKRYHDLSPEAKTARYEKHRNKPGALEKLRKAQRWHHLRTKYGLTIADYWNLYLAQSGQCAICKTGDSHHSSTKLNVDHSHLTGKVRSLLCGKCNKALGLVNDSTELLSAMIDYLTFHEERRT